MSHYRSNHAHCCSSSTFSLGASCMSSLRLYLYHYSKIGSLFITLRHS
nr:MAG TPA: hypothetical protein [Caudoviricetes sp.]